MTSLLHAISSFTAQAFVAGLWQGIVLIGAVAIGLRLLPRLSASIRFAIWSLTFALAATLPLLHLQIPTNPTISATQSHTAPIHLSAAWGSAIAAIWAIATIARIAQLLTQATRLHRIWRRATPVPADSATLALLKNGKRPTQLCTSTDIDAPTVIGFFSPRLLIPDWLFTKVTESELHQIVLHECEHLRRRDDWINLLQKIALVIFPLNPALLWVDRRLSLERELACDAGVVASTAAPFDYAHCLTRLAEHRLHRRSLALSLAAWSRQSELARRVHNLLRPMRTMSPLQARASITLLTLGLAAGAAEMARAPHLISFTDAITAPIQQAAAVTISQPAAHAIPVSYSPTSQPHEALLKAVMPQPTTKSRARKPRNQPRLILTTTPQPTARDQYRPGRLPVRQAYILTDFSPSYAAVPFGNGWLIIQL
jgi:beta-lactamase regulating signal transducer with metallopeptidase domain